MCLFCILEVRLPSKAEQFCDSPKFLLGTSKERACLYSVKGIALEFSVRLLHACSSVAEMYLES